MRSTGNCCVLTDDITACAGIVRRGDPSRFLATMAAPVAARRVLFPIYAFNVEVARAPWVTAEPLIAEMRLQWWRDVLGEIRAGAVVRRHEVATPLAAVIDPEAAALLDDLIAARRWDIGRESFADTAALSRHIEVTAGHLMQVAACALGPAEAEVLRDAGYALGLGNWLRAVPALAAAGRRPLPDAEPAAVVALAAEGLRRLARARARRNAVSPAARAALLTLWETGPLLQRASRQPEAVGAGTLAPAPMRSRLSLLLRAASGRW